MAEGRQVYAIVGTTFPQAAAVARDRKLSPAEWRHVSGPDALRGVGGVGGVKVLATVHAVQERADWPAIEQVAQDQGLEIEFLDP